MMASWRASGVACACPWNEYLLGLAGLTVHWWSCARYRLRRTDRQSIISVTYRKISNEEVSADMSNTPAVLLQPWAQRELSAKARMRSARRVWWEGGL